MEATAQAENKLYTGLMQQAVSKCDNDINGLASLKLNKLTDDALQAMICSKRDNYLLEFAALQNMHNVLHICSSCYFYTSAIQSMNQLSPFFSKKIDRCLFGFGWKRKAATGTGYCQ